MKWYGTHWDPVKGSGCTDIPASRRVDQNHQGFDQRGECRREPFNCEEEEDRG
jgi:hypothetical protein